MEKKPLMQCVPNFSEGRDMSKIDRIVDAFRAKQGVKLLDYSTDPDHNRCVVTLVGEPEPLGDAILQSVGTAVELIDMTRHEGQHPRIGCVDVIPFIPIRSCTMDDANQLAIHVAQQIAEQFHQPCFLYEHSASAPHRASLSKLRTGQFEGLAVKMKDPLWKPDFGPDIPHPTGGATAVGARMPLICFNINLATQNVDIAQKIARKVRNIDGGFRYVKALGLALEDENEVQVSLNMTDYTKTALYRVFETVKMEARRYGVNVSGSEIVGTLPMQSLIDCAEYYLQIDDFSPTQILETHI